MVDKTPYIQNFKKVLEQKNGRVFSDEEVTEYFEKMLALVQVIYKPIPDEEYIANQE